MVAILKLVNERNPMNKLIKDGKVAVLISGGYGSGWYTWNLEYPDMMFDSTIAEMVLAEKSHDEIETVATMKWPDGYLGGIDGLCVEWVDQGDEFIIEEYDVNETLSLKNNIKWFVA